MVGIRNFIKKNIFAPYSQGYKSKRKVLFFKYLQPNSQDKILDFGGDDGSWMAYLVSFNNSRLFIADINNKSLEIAKTKYSYNTILLDESGEIPFTNKYFDIVFCNSVIEHVTIDKNEINKINTNKEFIEKSLIRQKHLADEIRRVGKKYFVQTPYKHFIFESHTWFPSLYIYLPRTFQIKFLSFLSKYWIKNSIPDFHLLNMSEMKYLFPDAKIIKEKSFLLTKSLIAIKNY